MKRIDKHGYVRFTDDPKRTAWEHIRVAEKMLGRKLGKTEQIHHINGNKEDNSESNLLVLRSNKDHRIVHSKLPYDLLKTSDGSSVAIIRQKPCPSCQRLFEPANGRVVYCSRECFLKSASENIPDPAVLSRQVWEMPATRLAKLYNVSDRMIGKWCTKFGIARPGRGYWAKQNKKNSK